MIGPIEVRRPHAGHDEQLPAEQHAVLYESGCEASDAILIQHSRQRLSAAAITARRERAGLKTIPVLRVSHSTPASTVFQLPNSMGTLALKVKSRRRLCSPVGLLLLPTRNERLRPSINSEKPNDTALVTRLLQRPFQLSDPAVFPVERTSPMFRFGLFGSMPRAFKSTLVA